MDGSEGDTDSNGSYCGGDVGYTSPPDPYYVTVAPPGEPEETVRVDGGTSNATLCISAPPAAADAGASD
jgi:hypothetical protein